MGIDSRSRQLVKAGFDTELITVLEYLGCCTAGDASRLTRRRLACLPPSVCRVAFGQAIYRSLNRHLDRLGLPEIADDSEVAALVDEFDRSSGRRPWPTMLPIEWVLRDLSVPTLSRFGCRTLGDVAKLKRGRFACLRGYGQASWEGANEALVRFGLKPIPDDPKIAAQVADLKSARSVPRFRERAVALQRACRNLQANGDSV